MFDQDETKAVAYRGVGLEGFAKETKIVITKAANVFLVQQEADLTEGQAQQGGLTAYPCETLEHFQ